MDWYQNLYIGENIRKKKNTVIQKLEKQKRLSGIQIIILPPGEQNQLEIISSEQLYRYRKQEKQIRILGLAADKGEAGELVRQMAEEVLRSRGDIQIKEYFTELFEKVL